MPDCDELRGEIAHLRWRLDALERSFAQLARVRPALHPADLDWLEEFLPVVSAAVGDEEWALCHLCALALVPGFDALAAALACPNGYKAMGKRLARCAGHTVAGFTLLRVGDSRDGVVWQVRQGVFRDFQTRTADCAAADVDGKMIATLSR